MPVSMTDVARHAGVSQRTVSNVVNNFPHVAPATRARVEASIAALGYRPNMIARQLRSGRSGTICLALPSLRERYFADLAETMMIQARNLGLRLLLEITHSDPLRERSLLRDGGNEFTDGLILHSSSLDPDEISAARASRPLVLIGDRDFGGHVDQVNYPNREATREAVRHLLQDGRHRIALLGAAEPTSTPYALRRAGFEDALAEAGLTLQPDLTLHGSWTRDEGERLISELLGRDAVLPDAIFALNDSIALGAIRALTLAGVRVPDQVAIVGFDDIAEASHASPSLTTVAPNLNALAEAALLLINEQIHDTRGDRPTQHRQVGYALKIRESSGRSPRHLA